MMPLSGEFIYIRSKWRLSHGAVGSAVISENESNCWAVPSVRTLTKMLNLDSKHTLLTGSNDWPAYACSGILSAVHGYLYLSPNSKSYEHKSRRVGAEELSVVSLVLFWICQYFSILESIPCNRPHKMPPLPLRHVLLYRNDLRFGAMDEFAPEHLVFMRFLARMGEILPKTRKRSMKETPKYISRAIATDHRCGEHKRSRYSRRRNVMEWCMWAAEWSEYF